MTRPADADPRRLLRTVFGFDAFRPRQEEVVERVLAGGHALVVMPTGGGKSLCYQLPAILRPGVGLVVSPLISLMRDQVDALRQLGVRAAYLNSSLAFAQQRAVERRLAAGELDLVYVAPERLMTPPFLELLGGCRLALLAIDEAHCISQWGHDFRPEYLELARLRELFPEVPMLAVTATADPPTRRDISGRLQIPEEGVFVTGFDRPNLRFAVQPKESPRRQLLRFIRGHHDGEAGIVYCLSRRRVEEVAAWLAAEGLAALPYHAGLDSAERDRNQERFRRDEGVVMVATVAFGMGIDKPNVRFVAHLDLPRSVEAYYQEVGRAGRDGLPADAWMTYGLADVVAQRRLLDSSEMEEKQRWVERHRLNSLLGYCESVECRRRVLLAYFGEEHPGGCGNCDNCLAPVATWDGTVAAQKLLSCVYRTGQRFGAGHVLDVLLGRDTEKVRRFGHQRLSTFGIGEELEVAEWRGVVRQLVAAELLRVDVDGHGALSLTEASRAVLRGERTVALRRDPRPRDVARKPPAARRGGAAAGPLTDDGQRALFERLRALRLELARAQGVPPYVVFSDATLVAMVRQRPADLAAMTEVPGVGAVKLERYGQAFLDAIHRPDAGLTG